MVKRLFKLRRSPKAGPSGPPGLQAYAVGDVHGRLDLLEQLLGEIERDLAASGGRDAYLIFLGDLIDRGPDSRGVIERLRRYRHEHVQPVFLIGNHEEVLLRLLAGEEGLLRPWLTFGGTECAQSYGLDPAELAAMPEAAALELLGRAIPDEHVAFLSSFADTFRFGDYLFVHAGIRPGVELAAQDQADLRWIREAFLDDDSDHGCTIVHGHTISAEVDERPNRIGIDTGAYRSGVLTAVVIAEADRRYLSTAPAVPLFVSERIDRPRLNS